tara:strand:+ start:4239 stop:4766 length:528 start_codon:yes stop_codon:yes gene_type:complete
VSSDDVVYKSKGALLGFLAENLTLTRPSFFAYISGADQTWSDVGGGQWTTVEFNGELYASDDFANYTFTAPLDGRYFLCTTVLCEQVEDWWDQVWIRFIINDTSDIYGQRISPDPAFAGDASRWALSNSAVVQLDEGDTVKVQVRGYNSSSTITMTLSGGSAGSVYCHFSGHMLG